MWLTDKYPLPRKMGEVVIMNHLFPEWKPHSAFITDHLESALRLDSQRSSHPIQVDCPDANQINQIVRRLYTNQGNCTDENPSSSTPYPTPRQLRVSHP